MKEPRVDEVLDNIAEACRRAGRDPAEVKLMGVAKQVPAGVVRAAIRLGVKHIGENRVQEARQKAAEDAYEGAALCLIGHLQTNKASLASRLFDQVHAVDSERVAAALSKHRLHYRPNGGPLPVLLEVNVGGDPAKFGAAPEDALELAQRVMDMPGLELTGLMTVAPGLGSPEAARSAFRRLRTLRDSLCRSGVPFENLAQLSMGMSADYRIAVEEGSTIVRIGTALFGPRR